MIDHFSCKSKYTSVIQVINVANKHPKKLKIIFVSLKSKMIGIDLLLISAIFTYNTTVNFIRLE